MPELNVTYRGMVYPWHCDHMGHMNVMWYVGKFDEATWHLLALAGITPSYMRDNNVGMVAVEQHIAYKRELIAGDMITIRSGILEMKEKSIRFFHEMRNDETDEIAAVTVLTGVQIDHQSRRSSSLPQEIRNRAQSLIVEYDPGV
jgi:acyl-CoA thioester hydrolase